MNSDHRGRSRYLRSIQGHSRSHRINFELQNHVLIPYAWTCLFSIWVLHGTIDRSWQVDSSQILAPGKLVNRSSSRR